MTDTPTTTPDATGSLFAAMLKAQEKMGSVSKDAQNTYSKYDYASAERMVNDARKALIGSGLVLVRRGWDYTMDSTGVGEGDYPSARVQCHMAIVHPGSGESFEQTLVFPALSRKGTPIDKAIAASLTSSLAYWLRDILLIPRGDFGAVEQHDDTGYGGFSAEDAFSKCVKALAHRTEDEDAAAEAVRAWMGNFSDAGDDRPNKDDFASLWRSISRGEMDAAAKGEQDPMSEIARNGETTSAES